MAPSRSSKAPITFLVVLLVIVLLLTFFIFRPFFEPIAMAIIMAVAFQPIHRAIYRRLPKPNLASLLTIFALILIVAIPLTFILLAASKQAAQAAHFVGQKSEEQGGMISLLMSLLDKPLNFIGRYVDVSTLDVRQQIMSRLEGVSVKLLGWSAAFLGNLVGLIVNFVLALLAAFFFFRDGDKILEKMVRLMPLTNTQGRRLLTSIDDAIVANFYGIVAVGGVQGLLVAIALRIVGNHSSVLLGIAAAICSLVPLVGPALVWAPVAIYLFATGHIGSGIFLVIWCVVVVGFSDNIVRPLVVAGRVEAHPLLLLFALLGGAQAFGILGLFLGPILLSLIMAISATLAEVKGDPEIDLSTTP